MANIKMMPEDFHRRLRRYKTDPFIEGCRKEIERVLSYSKPHIVIYPDSPEKSIFDIDENSKKAIKIWKDRIDEYVTNEYSDLISGNLEINKL